MVGRGALAWGTTKFPGAQPCKTRPVAYGPMAAMKQKLDRLLLADLGLIVDLRALPLR